MRGFTRVYPQRKTRPRFGSWATVPSSPVVRRVSRCSITAYELIVPENLGIKRNLQYEELSEIFNTKIPVSTAFKFAIHALLHKRSLNFQYGGVLCKVLTKPSQ
ncbi:hypothetical protein Y032_0031g2331 [Ancylostoma ceylanicum]|uniref:Uncharacterized protein n=1 Tax=Ancylostoma ceylanicum TaxID=53326 RepID=A0A016UQJ3_9BILA|nr:hypothetical protein Y032_0031g2331 [Ancylostoma ceylanicum]